MLIFVTEAANLPFAVSLGLMIFLVLLEVLSLLLGAGVSGVLDSLLPDLDMDVDMDMDLDLPDSDPTTFMQILSWFRVGEVPLLMLLLVALTSFGISGLLVQLITRAITGELLPPLIAMIPACFCTIPLVRIIGGILSAYMPKDETSAVSGESLIGRPATLLAGTASQGKPVQGKVQDEHQQTHYVLIEPEHAEECIQSGETVILSQKKGAIYQAVHEGEGRG